MLVSEKRGDFLGDNKTITKSVTRLIFCAKLKVSASAETKKIVSEYLNNRNRLISKIEVVWQNLEKTSFKLYKLINQFLLFQCSCVYTQEKRGISWEKNTCNRKSVTGLIFWAGVKVGASTEM